MAAKTETVVQAAQEVAKKVDTSRRMHYPYTITAKLAHFPYKFHWEKSVYFRYYVIGVVACLPVFYKISRAVNSPDNVAKWDDIHRRNVDHAKHQFDH